MAKPVIINGIWYLPVNKTIVDAQGKKKKKRDYHRIGAVKDISPGWSKGKRIPRMVEIASMQMKVKDQKNKAVNRRLTIYEAIITFQEYYEQSVNNINTYKTFCSRIHNFESIYSMHVDEIDYETLNKIYFKFKKKFHPYSIRGNFTELKKVLNHCIRIDCLSHLPEFPKVPKPPKKKEIFRYTDDNLELIFKELKRRSDSTNSRKARSANKVLFCLRFLYLSGIRLFEGFNIQKKHLVKIDLEGDMHYKVDLDHDAKNKNPRIVTLNRELSDLVDGRMKELRKDNDYLFPLKLEGLKTNVYRLSKDLGVYIGSGQFRKNYISERLEDGWGIGHTAIVSGNSPEIIRNHYASIQDEKMGELLKKQKARVSV